MRWLRQALAEFRIALESAGDATLLCGCEAELGGVCPACAVPALHTATSGHHHNP
jgi:hypothetical protein